MRWVRDHSEFILLVLLFSVSLFVRFYRLPEYMLFLGDEGRDAIIVKKILTEFDLPLLGPPTSVGNMYLGPLYYYMMSAAMLVVWLNPVAASGMVALIGTGAVALIYYLTRVWFGKYAALISATLYSLSPVNINYSKFSWNPNPAPFFSLLSVFGLYKARISGDFRWFILTGVFLAFALQMHYLALILLPIFGLLWGYEFYLFRKGKVKYRYFIKGTLLSVVAFLFLMSPLLIFDLRHNFMNYRAITTFFASGQTVAFSFTDFLGRLVNLYYWGLVGRYMAGQNSYLSYILSVLILIPLILKSKNLKWPVFMLGSWLIVGITGLSLLRQEVYDHYLGFLNPAPFILLGASYWVLSKNRWALPVFWVVILVILAVNITSSPLKNPPNRQLQRTQSVAKFIIERSGNKPFNFALIAERNYDSAYQYYLDIYGHQPKQVPFDITDQLFVVCEDPVCQPINHPKYEIAGFGWSKIEEEQEVYGVRVYKLVHNKK